MTSKDNLIAEKSMAFAVRIVNLYKHLVETKREYVLSKQVLRAGTSIGANVREANSAQSKPDFIAKMSIALKECDETGYWLELLVKTEFLSEDEYNAIEADCREIFAVLTAILKSARSSPS
ncbi:MAG: four helix bundle protein [Kiritimatiellae bacterium]|nr:four helix bundle protein [Kiritimatiellia bacterium]